MLIFNAKRRKQYFQELGWVTYELIVRIGGYLKRFIEVGLVRLRKTLSSVLNGGHRSRESVKAVGPESS